MRTVIRIAAVAAALLTGSLVAAPPAPAAAPLADQYVNVINHGTGRCLDAFFSEGGGNGNRVGLWDCNDGISELWRLGTSGNSRYPYKLVNERSGRCLDYPAESEGRVGYQFKLWDCNGSASQNLALGNAPGGWRIFVQRNGSAPMDAYASGGGGNGNPVGIWHETGSPLQHWTLRPQ